MPTTESLLIRADAGPTIGAGHVMRCLALAQKWMAGGGKVTFACSELPKVLGDRLRSEGCEVATIDAGIGTPDDALATLNLARAKDAIVVADGYRFSVKFQELVHGKVKCLLVLDDYGQIGGYQADLILDQNLGTTEDTYRDRPPGCRLLLGSDYAMLRREFLDARSDQHQAAPVVRIVLVTTGGADIGGLTGSILEALNQVPVPLEITVVVGGAGPRAGAPEAPAVSSHHQVRQIENAANMPELMSEADLAISAAGSTAWELAYMGVPSVVIPVAANQDRIADGLGAAGAALAVRDLSNLSESILALVSNGEGRNRMARRGREIVDGLGSARVVEQLMASSD